MFDHSATLNRVLYSMFTIFAGAGVVVCTASQFVTLAELSHYLSHFNSKFVIKKIFVRCTLGQNRFCGSFNFCFFCWSSLGHISVSSLFLSLFCTFATVSVRLTVGHPVFDADFVGGTLGLFLTMSDWARASFFVIFAGVTIHTFAVRDFFIGLPLGLVAAGLDAAGPRPPAAGAVAVRVLPIASRRRRRCRRRRLVVALRFTLYIFALYYLNNFKSVSIFYKNCGTAAKGYHQY